MRRALKRRGLGASSERASSPGRRDRVASLGPLPPTQSGIATYHRAVLNGLSRIGFTQEMAIDPIWPVEERHLGEVPAYGVGIYHLGNNVEFHLPIYRMVWQAPGLVVLHDLALDDFVRGLQSENDPLGFVAVREALEARDLLRSAEARRNEPLRTPWAAAVARRARGIIVHADFCRRYLEEFGCKTPIFVVPHPPVETPEAIAGSVERGRRIRSKAEAHGARVLVVAAGDLNEAKRLDAVVNAAGLLDADVHVALVGRKVATFDVGPLVSRAGLGDRLQVEMDVSDEDFLGWLHAADLVVDLRHPHRGEVSGSLARAMQIGRPTIVSATGTYLDAPGDAVLHIAAGPPNAAELAERIRALADDPELRTTMGRAARAYMDELGRSEATAHGYADAIRATSAVVHDVTGPVMARWASSLADIGATQEHLANGYGLTYARAVESFKMKGR